jgi:hypothetical protein
MNGNRVRKLGKVPTHIQNVVGYKHFIGRRYVGEYKKLVVVNGVEFLDVFDGLFE